MSEDSSKYEMETMVSSSSKDATMCLACGAQVFTDFGSSSKSAKISLRCGNCGDLIGTGVKANAPREKTASRSLWLGLSSIILLFFTGIPAIYYGIKSLLKARHKSIRPQDRRNAILGIVFGSCFGVFLSTCVLGLGGVTALFLTNSRITEDFESSKLIYRRLNKAALPTQFVEGSANNFSGMCQCSFTDSDNPTKRTCRLLYAYLPPLMIGSTATIDKQLSQPKLHGGARENTIERKRLAWEIAGEPTAVFRHITEEVYDNKEGVAITRRVHKYYGFAVNKDGIYAASCVVQIPNEVYPTEEDVKAMFASIGAPENFDYATCWDGIETISLFQKIRQESNKDRSRNAEPENLEKSPTDTGNESAEGSEEDKKNEPTSGSTHTTDANDAPSVPDEPDVGDN